MPVGVNVEGLVLVVKSTTIARKPAISLASLGISFGIFPFSFRKWVRFEIYISETDFCNGIGLLLKYRISMLSQLINLLDIKCGLNIGGASDMVLSNSLSSLYLVFRILAKT